MSDGRFNPDGLVLSDRYAETMDRIVLPWLSARRTDLTVAGDGGAPLFCSRFDGQGGAGTVLVLHGFTENVDKYSELIHSLLRNGYSVVGYDQRGHGRSWRDPAISDRSLTHVDRFERYVIDLGAVCDAVLAGMPRPWTIIAHSMGGGVTALFLEQRPGVFARAALCSPMIEANLGGLPVFAGKLLCGTACLLGRDKSRVLGSRPFSGPEDFATSCATGRERFEWYDALRVSAPAFQNNGPTYGWTREAIRATPRILAPGAVERIDIPVRVYTAEEDGSVMPGAQERFAARLSNGRRSLVPGSRHEIYRSRDEALFPWWREILGFLGNSAQETV